MVEVVLDQFNLVNHQYTQKSDFDYITLTFTDHNDRPLKVEHTFNSILLINN